MCQVNSEPMLYRRGHLDVVLPPTISDKMSTDSVSLLEGQKAEFVCVADGIPEPDISWKRKQHKKKGSHKHIRKQSKCIILLFDIDRSNYSTSL